MIRVGETHLHIGVSPLSASPSRRSGSVEKSASKSKMFSYVISGWRMENIPSGWVNSVCIVRGLNSRCMIKYKLQERVSLYASVLDTYST